MPEALLPLFPSEATPINVMVSFAKRAGKVFYFVGAMPVFSHAAEDMASFRLITSQLVVNGQCTEAEVGRAFGVSRVSLCRYVKRLRTGGPEAFFRERKVRGGGVLTPDVLAAAQALFNEGRMVGVVAAKLGVKPDTLHKALQDGRLRRAPTAPKKTGKA